MTDAPARSETVAELHAQAAREYAEAEARHRAQDHRDDAGLSARGAEDAAAR